MHEPDSIECITVSFKCDIQIEKRIKTLIAQGLYPNKAECIRNAVIIYMLYIHTTQTKPLYDGHTDYGTKPLIRFSIKTPIGFMKEIDTYIKKYGFKDRSKFFRAALTHFFEDIDEYES